MGAEIEPVGFDDLASDRRRVRNRKHVEKTQIGLLQPDAKRVAIDDLEAGDGRIVVEFARFQRRFADGVGADHLAVDEP